MVVVHSQEVESMAQVVGQRAESKKAQCLWEFFYYNYI